jgi:hypothetical protein
MMSSLDTRAQLLGRSLQPRLIPYPPTTNSHPANLKCLYGTNVEVLTLCVDAAHDEHQAVAMSFSPFNGTWTKFLHSEPASSPSSAIENLLGESNKELTSIFSTNGITVPFQGNMMQTLTLCRGERRDSGAGSSEPSEFVFVATPGSSLSDNVPVEHVNDELPVEEALVEEVAEEPDNYELPVEEAPVEEATEPDDYGVLVEESPVEEVPEPGDNELLVEEAPAEEAAVAHAYEDLVPEESIPVLEESAPLCMDPEPVPPEPEAASLDWGTWFSSKNDKKKKTRFMFDESCPLAEEPSSQEVYAFDCPVEEVEPEPDTPYPQEERKADEVCPPGYVVEEVIRPEPEPDTPYPQDELKADEAGSTDCVAEEVKEPEPEPETRPFDNDFAWGSFSSKKDKKKKGKISVEIEKLKVEEIVPPSSESQVVEDDTWGDWGALPSKKSKKKKKAKDVSVELAPEPVVEDDSWGGWGAIGKKSKKKKDEAKDAFIELAPIPAVNDDWWKFATTKDEAKNPVPEPQPEVMKDEEPSIAKEPCDHRIEAPLDPEAIEHPATAPSLPGVAYTKTIAHASRPQETRIGQTVVFTIQYPNEINSKPLQAMITLAGNTRGAIFDAVNSYLDSKTGLMGKLFQRKRKLEIKSGVGKNGDVDLSALEETMWPEYLEYFRQYTRLPELTVDVVDC